jgi:EAL and modified HD-GYP domain-containing signal transduction protein
LIAQELPALADLMDRAIEDPMRFVVRQPIFNLREQVEGYELKVETPADGELDLVGYVEAVLAALERIPGTARATISCGLPLLTSRLLTRVPPARVLLGIDPGGSDKDDLLSASLALKKSGYSFALLDFETDAGLERWLGVAETVGIRMRSNIAETRRYVLGHSTHRLRMVAREVSNRADLHAAGRAGFQLFHGEYFLQPAQELSREVPSSKLASLELLKELRQPVLNLRALENLIKAEPSFCYRLLRYLNSAAFFGMQKVTSIRHAMTLLGDEELRRWLSLMAAVASSEGKPSEAVATAMLRARFCELLDVEAPDHGFMTGLFSLMPMIVNMQLSALLSVVRLPLPVDNALWGEAGPLRILLDLSLAYERAQWPMVRDLADMLGLTDEQVFAARGEATRWTNEIMVAQVAEPAGATCSR